MLRKVLPEFETGYVSDTIVSKGGEKSAGSDVFVHPYHASDAESCLSVGLFILTG